MAKFKYKFKSIKEIKQQLEKKTQKELAIIELEIANKKSEINRLMELLKVQKVKKLGKQSKTITELHFDEKYESYLVEQMEILDKYIEEKNMERKNKLEELVDKAKETKTFEKLEEKHFTQFVKEVEKKDQIEMDEFAVQEFLKG